MQKHQLSVAGISVWRKRKKKRKSDDYLSTAQPPQETMPCQAHSFSRTRIQPLHTPIKSSTRQTLANITVKKNEEKKEKPNCESLLFANL